MFIMTTFSFATRPGPSIKTYFDHKHLGRWICLWDPWNCLQKSPDQTQFLTFLFLYVHKICGRDGLVQSIQWLSYGLEVQELWFDYGQGKKFVLPEPSRPTLGPSKFPVQWTPQALSPGTQRMGRKSHKSLYLLGRVRTHRYNGTPH
jgi:hypothetical protein